MPVLNLIAFGCLVGAFLIVLLSVYVYDISKGFRDFLIVLAMFFIIACFVLAYLSSVAVGRV